MSLPAALCNVYRRTIERLTCIFRIAVSPGCRLILLTLLAIGAATACRTASSAPDAQDASTVEADTWPKHRDTVKQCPGLLRYYTFEAVTPENPVAESVAGEAVSTKYVGQEPLVLVPGRWAGKQAVRLDRGHFNAKPIETADRAFTLEIVFRKQGPGAIQGKGHPNGMLLAQGNGYWNGFRLHTDYPGKRLSFEIGKPQPDHAISAASGEPAPDGVWNHLAATWDGRQMRVYLNGLLVGVKNYQGEVTTTTEPLKIGYAGAGIGSLQMDVDEMAVYGRALSPVEILRHAQCQLDLPEAVAQQFAAAADAVAQDDWETASKHYEKIASHDGVATDHRALARLGLAQTLEKRKQVAAAVQQRVAVFETTGVALNLREIAARRCLGTEHGSTELLGSRGVYQYLLEHVELSPSERFKVRLCLAECFLREKQPEAARHEYELLLQQPELPQRELWNLRLQHAHTFLNAQDYAAARSAYEKIAADNAAPPEVRSTALLCIGHSDYRAKDFEAAASAFDKVAQTEGIPPHHRWEAASRKQEMQRLAQGLPARDPADSRVELPSLPQPAVTYYVAVDGDDTQPGTQQQPFATLRRARDAIRALKNGGGLPSGGVVVFVRGGVYPVRETFELEAVDSGTAEVPIVYRAMPGEMPVFTGGVKLDGFVQLADPAALARLPEEARGKVLVLDLKQHGVEQVPPMGRRGYGHNSPMATPWVDLYVDGHPQQLARWPNDGFVEMGKVHQGAYVWKKHDGSPGIFEYADSRHERWANVDDAWLFGYWAHLWAIDSRKIKRIDTQNRRVEMEPSGGYDYREGYPYYAINLLEELDRPSEWYLDRKTNTLHFWPPADLAKANVQMPVLSRPFVKMQNANHVLFRGLTFELGCGLGAHMTDCENVVLAGCTFRRLGTWAVAIAGGRANGVLGCDMYILGGGGVRVTGGDKATLTPAGHFVENCHIHDFTRVDRAYAPAVHLDGVGIRIAHNLLHDSPHQAIRMEGYEHLVELNEVHSVVYESDDQSGIDMWGNPALRGHVMRYNFWHHIGSGRDVAGQAGIRLDDYISAVLMYGNVFYRCAGGHFGGIQIHGGKDNIADNNLFVDCKQAFSFSAWGEKRWLEQIDSAGTKARVAQGGIDITQPPHSTRYPDLAHMHENADRNFLWRNAAVACERFAIRDRGVNELLDNHTFGPDAGIADLAHRDFTLRDDSPVYDRFGFRPIPFNEIGLYEDEYRATWPAEHAVTPRYIAD